MMIKPLNARATIIAMNRSWWPVHFTCWTKLKLHYVLLIDYYPIVVLFSSLKAALTILLTFMSIGLSLVALKKSYIKLRKMNDKCYSTGDSSGISKCCLKKKATRYHLYGNTKCHD